MINSDQEYVFGNMKHGKKKIIKIGCRVLDQTVAKSRGSTAWAELEVKVRMHVQIGNMGLNWEHGPKCTNQEHTL